MPVLEKGCCCVELETWAAFCGWLGVVFSIIRIIAIFLMELPLQYEIILIIYAIINIIVSALLIKSTKEKKSNLVVPWLVVTIIAVIIDITSQVYALVTDSVPKETVGPFVTGLLIGVALVIYFWLCIYSYYQQLSNKVTMTTKHQQIV